MAREKKKSEPRNWLSRPPSEYFTMDFIDFLPS